MPSLLMKLLELPFYWGRKRKQIEQQQREGYSVEIPAASRGEEVVYREGEKWVEAFIHIDWKTGVRLYTHSLQEWRAPEKGKRLTPEEYELVVKRISEYLSIEGEVTLDDSPPMTPEEWRTVEREMFEREGWEVVEEDAEHMKYTLKSAKGARET
jgi:hypothetical protein